MKSDAHKPFGRTYGYLIGVLAGAGIGALACVCYLMLIAPKNDALPQTGSTVYLGESLDRTNTEINTANTVPHEGKLTELDEYSSNISNSAALYTLLARSKERKLAQLLQQSTTIEHDGRRHEIQSAIGRRYAEINPRNAIRRLTTLPESQRHSFVEGVFREWSSSNLSNAVKATASLDAFLQISALETIIESRDDLPDDVIQSISKQVGYEELGLAMSHEKQGKVLFDDPREAWDAIQSDEIDDIYQLEAIVRLYEKWVAQDGLDVLSHIMPFSSRQWTISREVLAMIAKSNPRATYEYILNSPSEHKLFSLVPVLTVWAETDPLDVLHAITKLDNSIDSGHVRSFFVEEWTKTDPILILSQIELYPAQLRRLIAERAIGAIASSSPEEAISQMNLLEEVFDDTSSIAYQLSFNWSRHDPAATLDWILSDAQVENPNLRSMTWEALQSLAPKDPHRAIQIGLELPPHPGGGGFDGDVIRWLCNSDMVEEALELVPQVRDESRRESYSSIGDYLVESGQPERSMELAKDLTSAERTWYYRSIGYTWGRENMSQLLDRLPTLSEDARSPIAASILRSNSWSQVLTDEQVEFISGFVNEEDAEELSEL